MRSCIAELNQAIDGAIRYLLSGKRFKASFAKAHAPLAALCRTMAGSSAIDGDEVGRDSYADLEAFRQYLTALLRGSPTYIGSTRGEDMIGAGPGMSSSYEFHWDKYPVKAARSFNRRAEADLRSLERGEYENRRPRQSTQM